MPRLQPSNFMAWLPDGEFLRLDGYNGTRPRISTLKGTLSRLYFGMRGESGNETRPGYMNNVGCGHIETRRVSSTIATTTYPDLMRQVLPRVSDKIAVSPSSLHFMQIAIVRNLGQIYDKS